ncbi:MAG: HIT domain-containing protein [Candidatus Saccharimonadales bacterium]
MQNSIFTKIINGDIPAYKIYEDDKTIAFLDINPTRYGHTLVVPKTQIDQYIDLSDDYYDATCRTVKKVAVRLREVLGTDRVGVVVKGVDVPHAHVHLIPFNEDRGLSKDADSPHPSDEEFAMLAQKLAFNGTYN